MVDVEAPAAAVALTVGVLPDEWDGVGYKVVARVGQRYYSVWAGESTEYRLGVPVAEEARPRHGGGLYVCTSSMAAARHRIPAKRGGLYVAPRALLRCICEGPVVRYPGGKVAVSKLTPVEELPMPHGYLHSAPRGLPAPVQRPLPPEPMSPADLAALLGRPQSGLRSETQALEAEVAELERRLGYR
eukprot:TRINITY_DN26636_c0_g1_i1.p3 TRINITY_DN26636_c0_g1~~TRINITY_DN26636_c0_g1_i1.p3  ORF type:complete len:187 (+),score=33.24 TRINITY_DN26636_c0_g1_i1:78-638(+)